MAIEKCYFHINAFPHAEAAAVQPPTIHMWTIEKLLEGGLTLALGEGGQNELTFSEAPTQNE